MTYLLLDTMNFTRSGICLSEGHPTLHHGTIRHQKDAISTLQAIGEDVNPRGDNCCKKIEKVVGSLELQ
jgi:hypothetical protein